MKLSILAVLLGTGLALPQLAGLLRPAAFIETMRKFPRNLLVGRVLMLLATAWFLYYLRLETISDFAAYKPYMYGGFVLLGVGSCFYLQDFLAVRGLALLMLLLAKLMVDTARWHPSAWHLVIPTWAYVLVVFGMWFTVSPWKLRDFIQWATATESRVRAGCAVRLAFALFVIILGITVY